MPPTTRKCKGCGEDILINRKTIDGIAMLRENFYYHTECLIEVAEKKVKRNGHAEWWDVAHEHIEVCEQQAKDALGWQVFRDELNDHLLDHYNVSAIPNRFWNEVIDLRSGIYKKRKCKPIPMETLCNAWKWGQNNLDIIARRNKINKNGPQDDSQRLNYDLAIIIQKIPIYLKEKAKQEAEEAERLERQKNEVKINYNNIANNSVASNGGMDDISSLLDDIFD
jgi:hypothetical protein